MPKIDFIPEKTEPERVLGLDYEFALEKLYMEGPKGITPEEVELLALPGLMADENLKSIEQKTKDTLSLANEFNIPIEDAEQLSDVVERPKETKDLSGLRSIVATPITKEETAEWEALEIQNKVFAFMREHPELMRQIQREQENQLIGEYFNSLGKPVYELMPINQYKGIALRGKDGSYHRRVALARAKRWKIKQLQDEGLISDERRRYGGFWDELGRNTVGGGLNVASGLLGTLASVSEGAIWDKNKIEEWAQSLHRQAGEPQFSAAKGGGRRGFIASSVGQALPYMAASTVSVLVTGQPYAAFGVGFAVEGDNAYRDALAAGATEEEAQLNRLIVGTINGVIEQIQVSQILRFAKVGRGSARMVAGMASKKALARIAAIGGKLTYKSLRHACREALEEALQELTSIATQARIDPSVWDNATERIYRAGLGGGVVGLGFGGAGSIRTTIAQIGKEAILPEAKPPPEVVEKPSEAPPEAITPEIPPTVPAEPVFEEMSGEKLDALISKREDQILLERGGDELLQIQHRASEEQLTDLEYFHRLRSMKLRGEVVAPARAIEPTVKPEVKKKGMRPGKIDVSGFVKTAKGMMNIIEPTKIAARKVGKEPVAAVIRGIHETDVGRVEFEQKKIDLLDKSILDTEKELSKFPDKDLENLMLARGEPVSPAAKLLQKEAVAALPKALQGPKFRQAIQEVADFNFEYLRKVFGPDIKKFKDYFYGIYKDPKQVSKFLDHWQSTEKYLKEKKFPTYADAKAWGLEIKNPNPITNLRSEYVAISHISGMMWMKNELMRDGEGKYIWTKEQAPTRADKVHDWTFNDVRLEPDLAKLVNNLIAKNKITGVPVLNTIRQANNFIRTVKFVGSAFHLMSIAKQSIADSGYLGFLQPQKWVGFHKRPGSFIPIGIHKESAALGITLGFKKNDPIFQTPFYRRYIANAGGHRYAVESEAARAFTQVIDAINKDAATAIKAGMLPLQIPKGFVDWMFQSYIPKVKYVKTLDWYNKQSRKLGRKLTDAEFQEIIKEGQNFYGMMNERLFGRSGTVTTLMRFYFMSPGYAEGNYRTMIKAATQWGFGEEGFKASRSRSNIINSWLLTGILATVGTAILAGKWPKKPERLEDIRDLFKIDTGEVDNKGKAIMIDLLTYDKDYFNVAFNTLRLRPDIALDKSVERIGGMKAPMAETMHDLLGIAMGKVLIDWKRDEIFYPTDDFIVKMTKLINYEVRRLEPISISVYKQSRRREIDRVTAALESLAGLRPAYTEADRREKDYLKQMYSLRGQREELSWLIGKSKDPMGIVKKYNQTVNEILDSSIVPEELKDEWRPELIIDEMKVFTWKRFPPEKMTIAQLKIARQKRTYKADQKNFPNQPESWRPHKRYEERIKKINTELGKR